MGFNRKNKVLAHILSVCILSTMISTNLMSVNAEVEVTTIQEYSVSDQETETTTTPITDNEAVQTTIIDKFDFEEELQQMIDTYKYLKETQRAQAKEDTIYFIDQLIESDDYSIKEKLIISKNAIYNAVFNDVFNSSDAIQVKKNLIDRLNTISELDNLNSTINNILDSTISIETKRKFCKSVLDISLSSETISEDTYTDKLLEVETILEAQQEEQDERIAQEEAERLAKQQAEELAKQQEEQTTTTITTITESETYSETTVQSVDDSSTYVGFNGTISYNDTDFLALCNVVQHEVGNCSTLSKQMVASVVINRVLSGMFPNNIYDVVSQKNQFTGISAFIDRTDYATDDTKYWCQYVLDNGIDYSNGALFYYAPKWCGYMSYFENMTLVAEYEGQRFFK